MKKTFEHSIIYKGKFVRANTPIDVVEDKPEKVEETGVVENATVEEKPKRKGGRKNDKAGDREA